MRFSDDRQSIQRTAVRGCDITIDLTSGWRGGGATMSSFGFWLSQNSLDFQPLKQSVSWSTSSYPTLPLCVTRRHVVCVATATVKRAFTLKFLCTEFQFEKTTFCYQVSVVWRCLYRLLNWVITAWDKFIENNCGIWVISPRRCFCGIAYRVIRAHRYTLRNILLCIWSNGSVLTLGTVTISIGAEILVALVCITPRRLWNTKKRKKNIGWTDV